MIIDCFYYNGEEEVLEARLNILAPYVDKFIICEAKETFSGVPKDLSFKPLKFAQFNIEYFIMEEYAGLRLEALKSPNTGSGEHYWVREFIQKESARYALKDCNDDDIICISDVDEIWNPKTIYGALVDKVLKPKQLPYLYYFNQRTDEDWMGWTGTVVCRYKHIKDGLINHLRTDSMTDYEVIENGGWHFNAIGGKENKQQAFKHPVYYDDGVWKNREVNMRKDESDLPEWILNNKEKWTNLFLA